MDIMIKKIGCFRRDMENSKQTNNKQIELLELENIASESNTHQMGLTLD